jgi:hypothetical protein
MRLYGWIGFLLLLVSEYCLFRKIEPFHSWFYFFAWWSYILLADNLLLRLRGRSLLGSRGAGLWRVLPLSVLIWLIFEAYNLVLRNWAYNGVPVEPWLRWPGYAAAFATVLPAIFITANLLEHFLFGSRSGRFASEAEESTAPPDRPPSLVFLLVGLFLSGAPLLWPRYFFPAVWLGPIFLLDPLLEKMGLQSLARQNAAGNRRRIFSLLAAGMVCGLLWEFWNFWAPARWVYDVPFVGHWKVFEMPVLGFLGFPPFALECWILYHLLAQASSRLRPAPARAAFWLVVAFLCVLMFRAIDDHTVLSFISAFHRSAPA